MRDLFQVIETYLDAVPRSASDPEDLDKFTLFRPLGPWKYYARPRLGLDQEIRRRDVDELRVRQRELSSRRALNGSSRRRRRWALPRSKAG